MRVVAFVGHKGTGKSSVGAAMRRAAGCSRLQAADIEFSDALIDNVNAVLAHDLFSFDDFEWKLFLAMRERFEIQRPVPSREWFSSLLAYWERNHPVRGALRDWFDNRASHLRLDRANKAAHRVTLTWQHVIGQAWTKDQALFVRPIRRPLITAAYHDLPLVTIGGLRQPSEYESLRKLVHDLIVIKIVSDRVPEDDDAANRNHSQILFDTIYHANFDSPEASDDYVMRVIWPDVRDGAVKLAYGPLSDPNPSLR